MLFRSPVDALLEYQQEDGSFLWKKGESITGPATKQALVTLSDLKTGSSTWHRLGEEISFSQSAEEIPAEEIDKDTTTIEDDKYKEKSPIVSKNKQKKEKSPKTGDQGIFLPLVLFAVSLLTIIFIKKKEEQIK